MGEDTTIGKSYLKEFKAFAIELEEMVQPAKSNSLINVIQDIDPEKVKKRDPTKKSFRVRYEKDVWGEVRIVIKTADKLISKPEEQIPKEDFFRVLDFFDDILTSEMEPHLEALYESIGDRAETEELTEILNASQAQAYYQFKGDYNDMIRAYRRFRLKLNDEFDISKPTYLGLAKEIDAVILSKLPKRD